MSAICEKGAKFWFRRNLQWIKPRSFATRHQKWWYFSVEKQTDKSHQKLWISKRTKNQLQIPQNLLPNQKCNETQRRKRCMLISRNIWFNRLKSPGNYFYSGFSLVSLSLFLSRSRSLDVLKMRLQWLQMPSMMLGLLVSFLVARFEGIAYRWSTFIRNSYAVVPKMFQYLL